jgi:hypothetical protein
MPRLPFASNHLLPLPCASTFIATLLLILASADLQAQAHADASVEAVQNDNLGRFIRNGASDSGLAVSLAGGYHWQPGLFTSLTLSGRLRKSLWQQYSGLNSLDLAAAAELAHKFGIGELRPVLKAGFQAERQDFHNDVRDAWRNTWWLGLTKRVGGRLSLDLRLTHERSDGDQQAPLPAMRGAAPTKPKSGKVWDFSVNALRIGAEYELGPNAWLGSAFQFRDGPVVATAAVYAQPNPAALASTYDPVFGPHAVAYQLDARSRVYSIDYNRALSAHATAYAGFEYQHSTASSGVDYEVRLLRVGFIHGF